VRRTHRKKRDDGAVESPGDLAGTVDTWPGHLHHCFLSSSWSRENLLAVVPRRTGGDGLALVKVTPELIVHLHRQSRICVSSTVTGGRQTRATWL
jgi:hypothetical protein